MTTDNNEVKASQEEEAVTAEAQQIAEKINKDATETAKQEPGETQEQPVQDILTADKIAEITAKAAKEAAQESLNTFQGRFANYTADRERAIQEQLSTALSPVKQMTEKWEQAQVEQLDPEEQVEYWKNKAVEPSTPQAQPQVNQDNAQQQKSPEQEVMAQMTKEIITENGLTGVNEYDSRVWDGWNANMSISQLMDLARKNVEKMAGKNQPQQTQPTQTPQAEQTTPPPQTPPSTANAPKTGSNRVTTLSDLSELMARGSIDATQFRKAKTEINRQGYASL